MKAEQRRLKTEKEERRQKTKDRGKKNDNKRLTIEERKPKTEEI